MKQRLLLALLWETFLFFVRHVTCMMLFAKVFYKRLKSYFIIDGCSRLKKSDFNGQSVGGKMEIGLGKLALNSFKAYWWQLYL